MTKSFNLADFPGTFALVASTCSSPSPEFDTIPEEFVISVTKFRKRLHFLFICLFIYYSSQHNNNFFFLLLSRNTVSEIIIHDTFFLLCYYC